LCRCIFWCRLSRAFSLFFPPPYFFFPFTPSFPPLHSFYLVSHPIITPSFRFVSLNPLLAKPLGPFYPSFFSALSFPEICQSVCPQIVVRFPSLLPTKCVCCALFLPPFFFLGEYPDHPLDFHSPRSNTGIHPPLGFSTFQIFVPDLFLETTVPFNSPFFFSMKSSSPAFGAKLCFFLNFLCFLLSFSTLQEPGSFPVISFPPILPLLFPTTLNLGKSLRFVRTFRVFRTKEIFLTFCIGYSPFPFPRFGFSTFRQTTFRDSMTSVTLFLPPPPKSRLIKCRSKKGPKLRFNPASVSSSCKGLPSSRFFTIFSDPSPCLPFPIFPSCQTLYNTVSRTSTPLVVGASVSSSSVFVVPAGGSPTVFLFILFPPCLSRHHFK